MLGRYALGRHAIGRTPEEGSYAVNAEAGSFVWTGQDAGGAFNINFETDAGAFVWTGMDADRAQTKVILRARGSATPFLNLASSGGGRINIRGGRAC